MIKTAFAVILLSFSIFAQTQIYFEKSNATFTIPDGCTVDYDNEGLYSVKSADGLVEITLQEIEADATTISNTTMDAIQDNFTDVHFEDQRTDNFNGIDVLLDAVQCKDGETGEDVMIMVAVYDIADTVCIQFVATFNPENNQAVMDLIRNVAGSISVFMGE